MEKVDVFKYINSKDIREYLKDINYKFNMFEAMCIVNDAYHVPLIERLNAYKNIRYTFENCEFVESDGSKWINISKTIGNYIDAVNEFITSLYLEHGYIFTYEYLDFNDKNKDVHSNKELYNSFTDILENIKKEKLESSLLWVCRYKTIKDTKEYNGDQIFINKDYEISNIEQNKNISSIINDNPFNADNIKVPIPFKEGDIIWDSNCPINVEGKTLIYKFKEKVADGIKVIWDGHEDIETNYLSMEYYKK